MTVVGSLNQLARTAYVNSVAHGFYNEIPSIPERLCLIHSEVSEALECYRDGEMELHFDEKGKPLGFPTEIADVIIRIIDLAYYLEIDLDKLISIKMKYNESRPYRHGRKVL